MSVASDVSIVIICCPKLVVNVEMFNTCSIAKIMTSFLAYDWSLGVEVTEGIGLFGMLS